eukprot:6273524-Pyramimonas_sp.AAC.1
MEARIRRQARASANVANKVANNNQQEPRWVTNFATMAAAGAIFGNSQRGNFPAWIPANAEAQPPARHAPFFEYLRPVVKRFISWLEYSATNVHRRTPAINK